MNPRRTARMFDDFVSVQLSNQNRKLFSRIAERRRVKQLAHDELFLTYQNDINTGRFQGGFFLWLLENIDLVMAVIKKIMDVFGEDTE